MPSGYSGIMFMVYEAVEVPEGHLSVFAPPWGPGKNVVVDEAR